MSFTYDQVVPIRTRPHSVWMVELPDERRFIEIWHAEAKLEDVHAHVKLFFPTFRLCQLGVGVYWIGEVMEGHPAYRDDARWVDQDMVIRL